MKTFHISNPSDWYKLKKRDIYNVGGEKILKYYHGDSLYKVALSKDNQNELVGQPLTEIGDSELVP